LNLSQRQIPIVVQLDAAARQDLSVLERLNVPSSSGSVMLGQVATLAMNSGPAIIDRYDRSRNVNFEIELSGLPLGDVKTAVGKLPAIQKLPPGVSVIEIGDAEVMGELFASFGLAMLTGVLCIYIVAVQKIPPSHHHSLCVAVVARWGICRFADCAKKLFYAVTHRFDYADGDCHQELYFAGRICHCCTA
jgi:multidrug efflux pump subunit AcrB